MKISDLLESGSNVAITVTPLELKEFALTLIAETVSNKELKREDKWMSVEEVCEKLGVTKPTLWRWDKIDYLKKHKMGGSKVLYRESDVLKLMGGQSNEE